jgi:hypothetical protein
MHTRRVTEPGDHKEERMANYRIHKDYDVVNGCCKPSEIVAEFATMKEARDYIQANKSTDGSYWFRIINVLDQIRTVC